MGACLAYKTQFTWVLTQEWALSIAPAKTVTWALTRDATVDKNYCIPVSYQSVSL